MDLGRVDHQNTGQSADKADSNAWLRALSSLGISPDCELGLNTGTWVVVLCSEGCFIAFSHACMDRAWHMAHCPCAAEQPFAYTTIEEAKRKSFQKVAKLIAIIDHVSTTPSADTYARLKVGPPAVIRLQCLGPEAACSALVLRSDPVWFESSPSCTQVVRWHDNAQVCALSHFAPLPCCIVPIRCTAAGPHRLHRRRSAPRCGS